MLPCLQHSDCPVGSLDLSRTLEGLGVRVQGLGFFRIQGLGFALNPKP